MPVQVDPGVSKYVMPRRLPGCPAFPGIYGILNIKTNDWYVGESRDVVKRWYQHERALRAGFHSNKRLQEACGIYGFEAFRFVILERWDDPHHRRSIRERMWIMRLEARYNEVRECHQVWKKPYRPNLGVRAYWDYYQQKNSWWSELNPTQTAPKCIRDAWRDGSKAASENFRALPPEAKQRIYLEAMGYHPEKSVS